MKGVVVTKVNGCISNESEILAQVKFWLNDAFNGEYLLSFERTKKPRSNDQNRLMWVWFGCIAKSLSEAAGRVYTAQNVHDYYCTKFLPVTLPNGENAAGKTSGLTTEQMTDFLNRVQADAATEFGITLLSIADPMYALWAREYSNY